MPNPIERVGSGIQKIGSGSRRLRNDGWGVWFGLQTGVIPALVVSMPIVGAGVGTISEGIDIFWDFTKHHKVESTMSKTHVVRRGVELLLPIAVTIANPFAGAVMFGAIRAARGVDTYARLKSQKKLRDVRIG